MNCSLTELKEMVDEMQKRRFTLTKCKAHRWAKIYIFRLIIFIQPPVYGYIA